MAIAILLTALLTLLSVQFATPASNQTFWSSTGAPWAPNPIFQDNLKNVLQTLESQSMIIGFYNSSFGEAPNRVHGLYLCRGDLDGQACYDCVSHVKDTILTISDDQLEWFENPKWQNYRELVIRYEHCMVRYSNNSFLGKLEEGSWGASSSKPSNGTWNLFRFMDVLRDTMVYLPVHASNDGSGKKFATKVTKLSRSESLYAIAQCTWDMSPYSCNKCLTKLSKGLLRMNSSPRSSGRADSANCMVRYETFPFFRNIISQPSSAASLSLSMTDSTTKSLTGPHLEGTGVV